MGSLHGASSRSQLRTRTAQLKSFGNGKTPPKALRVLRGIPAEKGDGRRRCFAGCSREETSSLDQILSVVLLSPKDCRRELLLSLSLQFLDRRTLLSLFLG